MGPTKDSGRKTQQIQFDQPISRSIHQILTEHLLYLYFIRYCEKKDGEVPLGSASLFNTMFTEEFLCSKD